MLPQLSRYICKLTGPIDCIGAVPIALLGPSTGCAGQSRLARAEGPTKGTMSMLHPRATARLCCLCLLLVQLAAAQKVVLLYSIERHGARNVLPKSALLQESDSMGGPTLLPEGQSQAYRVGELAGITVDCSLTWDDKGKVQQAVQGGSENQPQLDCSDPVSRQPRSIASIPAWSNICAHPHHRPAPAVPPHRQGLPRALHRPRNLRRHLPVRRRRWRHHVRRGQHPWGGLQQLQPTHPLLRPGPHHHDGGCSGDL